MTDARQLAGCLTQDVCGKSQDPFKNENHPVHVEFGKHSEQIEDSSGEIHQDGLFHFQKPINESKCNFDVFHVPFGEDEGDCVTVLQLLFREQTGGMSFASPSTGVKKRRKTESRKSENKTKKRAADEQSMVDEEDEEEFMDAESANPSPTPKQSKPDNDFEPAS